MEGLCKYLGVFSDIIGNVGVRGGGGNPYHYLGQPSWPTKGQQDLPFRKAIAIIYRGSPLEACWDDHVYFP